VSALVDGSPVLIHTDDYFEQERHDAGPDRLDRRAGDIVRPSGHWRNNVSDFLVHHPIDQEFGPGYYELTEQGLDKLGIESDDVKLDARVAEIGETLAIAIGATTVAQALHDWGGGTGLIVQDTGLVTFTAQTPAGGEVRLTARIELAR